MNVTLKISEEVCRQAKHRAVDEGLSLSGWVTVLIARELGKPEKVPRKTALELFGCDELADFDLDFPRDQSPPREVDFS